MNALPVAPEDIATPESRARYFQDLGRWHFDIAYTGVYAHSIGQVTHEYRDRYVSFAKMAHEAGVPACVQIACTLAPLEDVPISEAQHYRDGTPDWLSEHSFFASFASRRWRDFLSELTAVFFTDYGYDWVVFEEPMYRVDVPGQPDRFVEEFQRCYPGVELPTGSEDTTAYRLVQDLKEDILTDFLREMMLRAHQAGAKRAGVMPWFFIPTIENTPAGSLNTSCDTGRIVGLPELDFVVVRMQPDNIYANVMRTGDEMQESPLLYYPEVMAHQLGKPVLAVNNPSNEHVPDTGCPLLPLEFFQRAALAEFAAAPDGLTRHWYGYNYQTEGPWMDFFSDLLLYCNRLGGAAPQMGYVISHAGARHGAPHTWETNWQRWWALGREMMLERLYPVAMLWASDLQRELRANPRLRLLAVSSAFPLTPEQMGVVERWLVEDDGRGLVVFAESTQLSADPLQAGPVELEQSLPGLHRLLGLPRPSALADAKGKLLLAMDPARAEEFAQTLGIPADSPVIQRLRLQEDVEPRAGLQPRRGTAIAVLPLGPVDMPEQICRFVRGLATHCGAQAPILKEAHVSVLWNQTACGFVVLANTALTASDAQLRTEGQRVWDVVNRRMLEADARLTLPPLGFALLRPVSAGKTILDVDGQMCLLCVKEEQEESGVRLWKRGPLLIRSTREVVSAAYDGVPVRFSTRLCGECWETRLELDGLGECEVRLAWKVS